MYKIVLCKTYSFGLAGYYLKKEENGLPLPNFA